MFRCVLSNFGLVSLLLCSVSYLLSAYVGDRHNDCESCDGGLPLHAPWLGVGGKTCEECHSSCATETSCDGALWVKHERDALSHAKSEWEGETEARTTAWESEKKCFYPESNAMLERKTKERDR